MWWREEDSNLRSSQGAADLQSAAINHSAISPNEPNRWSWRRDLNPRPSDYKSDALPTELRQPVGKHPNIAKRHSPRKNKYRRRLQISAAGSLPGMATIGTKTQMVPFVLFVFRQHFLTRSNPILRKAEHHVYRQDELPRCQYCNKLTGLSVSIALAAPSLTDGLVKHNTGSNRHV